MVVEDLERSDLKQKLQQKITAKRHSRAKRK